MKQLVFLPLLVLSLSREGASTHLETCDCHEIKDIVNATVQEAITGLEDKLNISIAKSSEQTSTELESTLSATIKSTLSATIKSALQPIKAQLNYHLPVPPLSSNSEDNPVASCKELKQLYPDADSANYWVKAGEDGAPVKVYCNMSLTCGGVSGGWMKVADLDMRDTSQSCPSGFFYRSSPKRVCDITSVGCVSEEYSVHDIQYNHVCGRVIGYQFQTTAAFHYFDSDSNNQNYNDIDGRYVFGVSLTHGSVNHRSHIWTFAGSSDETSYRPTLKCPCINTNVQPSSVQSFIGNDYFCDTAQSSQFDHRAVLHPSDPLWDGEGCGPTNACCNFPSDQVKPPWFYKHLSQGTTDDIEMRLCRPNIDGSTPIEIVELYVQ